MPREVLPLVHAVNQALDRLDEGFRGQREFTADAAHELRTPLAILRTQIDMIADRELARSLRHDVENMSRLVNQLLEMAELETFVIAADETADLVAVAAEVAAFLAPIALVADDKTRRGDRRARPGAGARQRRHARPRGAQSGRERARPHPAGNDGRDRGRRRDGDDLGLRSRAGRADGRARADIRPVLAARPAARGNAGLGLSIVARIAERHGARSRSRTGRRRRGVRHPLSGRAAANEPAAPARLAAVR